MFGELITTLLYGGLLVDLEEFKTWQSAVEIHSKARKDFLEDRSMILTMITDHLKQFFDFDEIDFSENFDKITLKFRVTGAVIRADKIKDLNMDWIISPFGMGRYSLIIDVYPFGLPNKDIFWVDGEAMWDD